MSVVTSHSLGAGNMHRRLTRRRVLGSALSWATAAVTSAAPPPAPKAAGSGATRPVKELAVLVPGQAGPPMQLAARELQKYLDRLAGVRVQVIGDAASEQGPRILLSSATS